MWIVVAFIAGLLIGHFATFIWISWPRRPW
jgi:uncharacterized protein YneF (UPF0154 family)